MALETTHTPRQTDAPSTDGAGATQERDAVPHTSWPAHIFGESLTPQPTSPIAETSAREVVSSSESGVRETTPQTIDVLPPSPEASLPSREAPPASGEVTRERFNAEMSFEPRGYRPVAFYGSVEQALASKVDPAKFEVFVDVKKGGFTTEEVAAIPDNAKRNNYHIGFARQLFDVNEGIFTKGFWTSSEGIKKVLTAGFIKTETDEIHLEAAQWLLSRREAATPPLTPSPTDENSPATSSQQEIGNERFEPPVQEASLTTPVLRNEPKVFQMTDLQPLEARLQERFAALKASIAPRTLTVEVDDVASIDTVIQNLHFYKDFNKAFAEQVSKTQAVLEQVGKLGLDQPSQGGVFKKKQEDALRLIDTLSFSKSDLSMVAHNIETANANYLPGSIREAVKNADPFLDAIKKELEEARNIIRNARRINPAPTVNQPNPEEKSQVVTGSVAAMPRLGKELTVNPKKLESMGHAMVDANVPDQEMNAKYKAIMSEFVKSYVSTFSKVRKEIYEARMDGSNLSSLQKEKFTYLAEELGQQVQVSDLMEIGSSKPTDTTKAGAHFGRIVDGSSFQKKVNQMKEEFSKALMKEIEKTPGTEDTDTTYVAYKRQRYEKSGITEFLKS